MPRPGRSTPRKQPVPTVQEAGWASEILKYEDIIKIQCMWNVKASDTSNKRGEWNNFKITQTIPEQHTRKA